MATQQLDLEEQEQLAQLKHYWDQYGNLISWILIAILSAFAAWNGYQYWENRQSAKAAGLFDEVEKFGNAKDFARMTRALQDVQNDFSRTTYAQQATLLAAKVLVDNQKADEAKAALTWASEHGSDEGYQALARLRLAGLLIESKSYDEALKQLGQSFPKSFAPLVADRKGDVLTLQGKKDEAKAEYLSAYKGLEDFNEYRRTVEAKLNALGVDPSAAKGDKP